MSKATDVLKLIEAVIPRNIIGTQMSDVPSLAGELRGTGIAGNGGGEPSLVKGEPDIKSSDAFGFESDPKKADDNKLYNLQAILPKDEVVPAK